LFFYLKFIFYLQKLERGSEQENEIIEHHQRLVGEKEQLSRRQDYLNFQLELSEVDFKIINLRKLLATSVGENEENLNNEGIFLNINKY